MLSSEAAVVLRECYLKLRKQACAAGSDAAPITTRTLEALIRLAEARAKLECRERVLESDARDVVELYESTLPSAVTSDGFDPADHNMPTAFADIGVRATRRRPSNNALMKNFVSAVREFAQRIGKKIFTTQELTELANQGPFVALTQTDFKGVLEQLNARGEFLKKRNDATKTIDWLVI